MIKANELRTGNWIFDGGDGNGQVTSIENDGWVTTTANNLPLPAENYRAIPITPEILEKAGATIGSHLSNADAVLKVGALKMRFRFYNPNVYAEIGEVYLSDHIKYLHQLQNLYFALTGEELEIKAQ